MYSKSMQIKKNNIKALTEQQIALTETIMHWASQGRIDHVSFYLGGIKSLADQINEIAEMSLETDEEIETSEY